MQLKLTEIDSTQLELKRRLEQDGNLPHLSFVQADRQTGGKGRQERAWSSPVGNLFISILLRGPHPSITWVPLWMAACLRRACMNAFSLQNEIHLKWPNDLIVPPFSKLSGILCEKVGDHVIAGVGVNTLVAPKVEGREVVSLQELTVESLTITAVDRIRDTLLNELRTPLSIEGVRAEFDQHGLIQQNDEIEWLDVGTQQSGAGKYLGIGAFGELKVQVGQNTQSLFSEEVTQIKKR